MPGRTYIDLPLQALLMAVWRHKPKTKVQVHSDQGSQFTSYEWQGFLKLHNLTQSMSRRRNCWETAVAESFFNLLKRESIRRRKYNPRTEARQDVFNYIAFFYNPQRKHVRNGRLSQIDFEQQQKLKLQGVQETRGYSPRRSETTDGTTVLSCLISPGFFTSRGFSTARRCERSFKVDGGVKWRKGDSSLPPVSYNWEWLRKPEGLFSSQILAPRNYSMVSTRTNSRSEAPRAWLSAS